LKTCKSRESEDTPHQGPSQAAWIDFRIALWRGVQPRAILRHVVRQGRSIMSNDAFRMNRFTLRFADAAVEAAYSAEHARKSVRPIRIVSGPA